MFQTIKRKENSWQGLYITGCWTGVMKAELHLQPRLIMFMLFYGDGIIAMKCYHPMRIFILTIFSIPLDSENLKSVLRFTCWKVFSGKTIMLL